MKLLLKSKKMILVVVVAIVCAIFFLILLSRPVQTTQSSSNGNKTTLVEKGRPEVLVTKDKDGYGLQFLARGFKNVKKVEMLVSYSYKGKENPSLLASGLPQQDSYWAHFRFESCSRGDCLYYKVREAKFQLTLIYNDGSASDHSSTVNFSQITTNTPLKI